MQFFQSVLSRFAEALILFGGILTGVDILIGRRRLRWLERYLKVTVLRMTYGDVYNSYLMFRIWSFVASPLDHISGNVKVRKDMNEAIKNRDTFVRYMKSLEPKEHNVIIDTGSDIKTWKKITGGKNQAIPIRGYWHVYSDPARDQQFVIGAPSPSNESNTITRIDLVAPGVILCHSSDDPNEVEAELQILYVYIEPYVENPLSPGKSIQIPSNPLFSGLYDHMFKRVLLTLSRGSGSDKSREKTDYDRAHSSVQTKGSTRSYPDFLIQAIALWRHLGRETRCYGKQAWELITSVSSEALYLLKAIAFNIISVLIGAPLFGIAWLIIYPFRACQRYAQNRGLESYVKLVGMLAMIIGGIIQWLL